MPKIDVLSVVLLTSTLSVLVFFVVLEGNPSIAGNATRPSASRTATEMVYIPGGTYRMGYTYGHADEKPVHNVTVSPFLLDRHEVTNRQFTTFVTKTNYTTQAERDGYAWCYVKGAGDFAQVKEAYWKQPEGPGSSIIDRMDHPVVCVSWRDATTYAKWAGKRLPTEAQWEYAARAGGGQHTAARLTGSEPSHDHHTSHSPSHPDSGSIAPHPSKDGHDANVEAHTTVGLAAGVAYVNANTWQGIWPKENQLKDGFFYAASVGSFEPNTLGLEDMIGNVWEWTADWYTADYYSRSPRENPTGADTGENRVARGGSWFCSPNYCGAYNSHYRGASPPDHAFNNVGFRCAADIPSDYVHASAIEKGDQ